jgi:FkbM family methyltransferase
MEARATKTIRLGGRTATVEGLAADDEYLGWLEDGSDDDFWRVIRHYVRPGDVCFDIGANIGITSLLLSQLPADPEVHAFEPGPRLFEVLRRNLAANGARRVTAVAAAVGSEARRARFLEASAFGHLSAQGGDEVEVVTLPGYMAAHGVAKLDFCKLDIEGSEWRVLKNALPIFARDRTIVFFEFNSWCQMAYGETNPKEFIDWICATFPAVYSVRGPAIARVTSPLAFLQANLTRNGCVDDLLVSTDPERLGEPGAI